MGKGEREESKDEDDDDEEEEEEEEWVLESGEWERVIKERVVKLVNWG